MDEPKETEMTETYELALGNRATLIALLEILEEKGILKRDDVFAHVLEGFGSKEGEEKKRPPGTIPFRRSA